MDGKDKKSKLTDKPEQKTLIADCDEAGDCQVVDEAAPVSDMALVEKDDQAVAEVESPLFPSAKTETEVTLNFIQRIISDPNADMAKFDKIIEWRNAERNRLAEIEFSIAMAACQGEIEPVARGAYNEHTESWFAKVDAIVESIAPIYSKHGFSLVFSSTESPEYLRDKAFQRLTCQIRHSSGHIEVVHSDLPIDDKGSAGATNKTLIQGLSSTRTYSRKYMITEIFNVPLKGVDQDGNAPSKEVDADKFNAAVELLSECKDLKSMNATFAKIHNSNTDKDFRRQITTVRNQLRESFKERLDAAENA